MLWTEEKLREFTSRPLIAVLATTSPSGAPQAVPVWYDYDGSHFRVTTMRASAKVRNIQRDSRVTLVVIDTSHCDYSQWESQQLIVHGRAELKPEGAQEVTALHAKRYLPRGRVVEARDRYLHYERLLISIFPEKFVAPFSSAHSPSV